ncbi:MAG: hypothetical protein B6D68_03900, partial [spirochete symbiont of Stewartia floridana]
NRIGSLPKVILEHGTLRLPVGIYSSTVISCDISDNSAIHNVAYLSRMQIEERCILFNVDELETCGHGLLPDEESREARKWVEIANENGGRRVLPFAGMLPADAWLWSKYRDDGELMARFLEMTDRMKNGCPASYGLIAAGSVIKNCHILKNIRVGQSAYIKGVNTLENLIINSSTDRQTQIGEGCELVDGIIGYGCKVFFGVKAISFVMNDHSVLKYGAKFIHSILGANSSVACSEILNSLLFGTHIQHHSTSFLCSSVIKGMSNIAAAANIGSNHNSRAADGEIVAERGFWPGLDVSLKHNSSFAAFCLIAKGSYPAELDISLPFCLVSNDKHADELKIVPGYWFRHNMYSLARNSIKTALRDKRSGDSQRLEYDWLAPDTVDQMQEGRRLLEELANKSDYVIQDQYPDGRSLLLAQDPDLFADTGAVESGSRPVRILHAGRGWRDYGRMIRFYAVRTLLISNRMNACVLSLRDTHPSSQEADAETGFSSPHSAVSDPWENVGGQLIRKSRLEEIKKRIKAGEISDWNTMHTSYAREADIYPDECCKHAVQVLRECAPMHFSPERLIAEALETAKFIYDGIIRSRQKDYENKFRNMVYDTAQERDAVLGTIEDDKYIKISLEEFRRFEALAGKELN